ERGGGADQLGGERDPGREAQGPARERGAVRRRPGHGPGPVPPRLGGRRGGRRVPRGEGHSAGLQDGDVRRGEARRAEPPVGGRALLHPRGQAHAPSGDRDRRALQARTPPAIRQADVETLGQNQFVVRVQPDEGLALKFGSKVPGTAMELRDIAMDFQYGEAFTDSSPEAYERLILDVLIGDRTLFPDAAEVEASWRVV